MRTTDAASTDVANQEQPSPPQEDTLFRNSSNRLVEPPIFPTGVRFADTHTHLDMLHYPGLALARCAAHAVDFVVTVVDPTEDPRYTYDNLDAWHQVARTQLDDWGMHSARLPKTRIIIGCHPHNASAYDSAVAALMTELIQQPITAAIGEIGLDYHYDYSPRDVQQRVFREQIRLAHELDLPISLHLREAHEEGLAILRQEGLPSAGALLHCFNLDYDTLEPFLELGCKVAFGGPLTFKKSDDVRQAAAKTPWSRIMTETDAPFMTPHPLRGTICGPEHVIFTAATLAEVFSLQGQEAADFYQQIHANAVVFFSEI